MNAVTKVDLAQATAIKSPTISTKRPRNRRREAKERPLICGLSFVADRDGVQLPKPSGDEWPRSFWNVTSSGDYGADCVTGEDLALEYLTLMHAAGERGHLPLQWIVADMPSSLTGVEIGFLTMVSYAASDGAYRARRLADYWDSMDPQRRAGKSS